MIKIIKQAKTVIVIGKESNEKIYSECQEWLYHPNNLAIKNFITKDFNNNLTMLDNWEMFFRKELK